MKLLDYYARLATHDWWYLMSDDGRAYRAGHRDKEELRAIANESPEHEELFQEWNNHIFGDEPKPEIPPP